MTGPGLNGAYQTGPISRPDLPDPFDVNGCALRWSPGLPPAAAIAFAAVFAAAEIAAAVTAVAVAAVTIAVAVIAAAVTAAAAGKAGAVALLAEPNVRGERLLCVSLWPAPPSAAS